MTRARTIQSLPVVLCLLLAASGNDASQCLTPDLILASNMGYFSLDDAIKPINLAKQTAAKLPSPPREFNSCVLDIDNNCPDVYKDWPYLPGAQVHDCRGYDIISTECYPRFETFTTTLSYQQGRGQYVTFSSEWMNPPTYDAHHSWQFFVGNERNVQFLCEQGDPLLKPPE